jgi:hypothetical protein
LVSRVGSVDDGAAGNRIVLAGDPKHDAAIEVVTFARLLTPLVTLDTPHLSHECELNGVNSERDDLR